MIKNLKNIKFIVIGIAVLLLAIIITVLCVNSGKVSDIEKIAVKNVSSEFMMNAEYIDEKEKEDLQKYIAYVIMYCYNKSGNPRVSVSEVRNTFKEVFGIKVSKDDVEHVSVTPKMLEHVMSYYPEDKEFEVGTAKLNQKDIAKRTIYSYTIDGIAKRGNNLIVTYNEYAIDDPYTLLNYYDKDNKDSSKILAYLKGNETEGTFKSFITEDYLKKEIKDSTKVKVTYKVDGEKILFGSISRDKKN